MRYLASVVLSLLLISPVVFAQSAEPAKDTEQKKLLEPSEKDLHEILEAFRDSDKILKQNVARREFVEVEGTEYPGLELDLAPIGQQVSGFKPRMGNVLRLQAQDEYMLYRSYDYTRSLTGRPQKPSRIFQWPVKPLPASSNEEDDDEDEPDE